MFHSFPSCATTQLIYNVPAVFTAPYSDQTSFEQLYFFPKGYKAVTSKA